MNRHVRFFGEGDAATYAPLPDQTKLESEPPLALRMLDYWVRLHRLYRLPVAQVVVLLLPPAANTVIETAFVAANTRHEYQILKLWKQDPALLLADPALLPLACLASATPSEALLQQVADQVRTLEGTARQEASSYSQILAGLKYDKTLIRRLFREDMMRESVIYQEILEEGRQEGRQIGLQEGLQEGRQEGERLLVLRLLTRRVGQLPAALQHQIETLPLDQLEALAEALLEFQALPDLEAWLNSQSA